MSLLLGERASADIVRGGAARAVVEAVFDIGDSDELRAILEQQGIESVDGLLILRREVAAGGRSRAWVNGAASTVTLLGDLGRHLVDLHGQHEHQTLLRMDEQRRLLDAYAGVGELARDVRTAHSRVLELRARREELEQRRRDALQRADYLRFQVSEIEAAHLREGEEEQLNADSRRLEHSEELARLSSRLHQELYGADVSLSGRVAELRRVLDHLIRIDPSQQDAQELLDTARFNLEELGRRMGDYAADIEHDPARLDEIRRRQDLLYRLKAKYGPELSDVIRTGETAREELDLVDAGDVALADIERQEAAAVAALRDEAAKLTKGRKKAVGKIATEINAVMPDLGMTGGRFEVELEPLAEPTADGAERVRFLISLNAGFEPKELARVASGGEMSRVMLALKTVLARVDRIPTLVFDEIDAGIGGKVAVQVGAKLQEVSGNHQVFVISHLPQIASRAMHHLLVEKVEREGTTLTRVSELHDDDRVRELARMLGGDPESATSLRHARELLRNSA